MNLFVKSYCQFGLEINSYNILKIKTLNWNYNE